MERNYKQGHFQPRYPEKYKGSKPIIFRSSWERHLMLYCDKAASVIAWGSESNIIPYVNPFDKKYHRYFVDFYIRQRKKDGTIKTFLVEVKPKKECEKPKLQGKSKKRQMQEAHTYIINQTKWKAARAWCDKREYEFIIMTEHELGIK